MARNYLIHANLYHNSVGEYGICMHLTKSITMIGSAAIIEEKIRQYAPKNGHKVKISSAVNAVSINTDDQWVMQVSGYSPTKGMYCEML